uniref:cAMP-responsive element modulator-like isoform X2 n=1 Tax=Doryrhamphus excisus TaxID=161450 RepID=UPI0025ADB71C|nr:cAMP-responsive element modulator-like isoform X2 [Doryrhamphus excisus]
MDSPPSHGLSIEASQALSSMTINSQPLPSESNASEYYANMWSYPNNYFPAVQGDMTAPQLQYTSSFFPKGVVQGHPPRKQSERSLKKNREAAREYRKRRKVYVRDLEKRAEQLENENLALKEELKSWKICPEKVK